MAENRLIDNVIDEVFGGRQEKLVKFISEYYNIIKLEGGGYFLGRTLQ